MTIYSLQLIKNGDFPHLGLITRGHYEMYIWLVVEPYPSEKYEFVNWDDDHSQYMEKYSSHVPRKPPTSNGYTSSLQLSKAFSKAPCMEKASKPMRIKHVKPAEVMSQVEKSMIKRSLS